MELIKNREYLRSVVFGIEDSLVSTTGLIAGISVASDNRQTVLLGGLIAIIVEAVSMGAGEYLSDDSISEFDKLKRHKDKPRVSGMLMLVSYFCAGLIPLAPVFITDYPTSLWYSVGLALIGLFALGYVKGRVLKTNPWRGGLKILFVGGLATAIGVLVGYFFKI
ncbi:VIT1/CCC1 transporter family protein [Candidatus Saccharibacteria bacterium]|nr:VIT1/CCC1 transporter family protein [Candidatus Saccharibacteria bacterium]